MTFASKYSKIQNIEKCEVLFHSFDFYFIINIFALLFSVKTFVLHFFV